MTELKHESENITPKSRILFTNSLLTPILKCNWWRPLQHTSQHYKLPLIHLEDQADNMTACIFMGSKVSTHTKYITKYGKCI